MNTRFFHRQRGFSLVELVITIVVIAIALTAVLLALDTATRSSANPMAETQAIAIGQAYLEEIQSKSYAPLPCPAPCTRSDYNDVDDYNGLVNVGAENQFGQPIPGLSAYTVDVTVSATTLDGAPAKLISVNVTRGNLADNTLAAYRLAL
ncbi:MshA pilin protein MshD [mine drainage metagenome]|uniref:MshA pilin protein MshD n=2 Tax=mine drainage metagenome TaxID=410659 RepID=T1BPJ1_9ZZZZ